MKTIKIEKLTLNIGAGEPGAKLEKAQKLLDVISGMKSVQTLSKKRIPTWNLRPKLPIGCKVTIRGEKAVKLLKRLLEANSKRIKKQCFDQQGNVAFGVSEYISIPDVEYDANIGIIGLQVCVTLQRPGFRIRRRRLHQRSIPKQHQITKDDAIKYFKDNYKVSVK
ncbi:50S ribosomal protein L5 [archaeon]|nr:50S ribosomal protein L5 [archaeon]|tara:strand:+ start:1340 stop:1837 length:498 start_codon:yes stop_codon:yes gene_type:complete